ncbi:MAG TPA: response regulator, partial [Thermoanaerobaculia bacterium]|nr:response regulator [Thermoanaerobaculia bacterium]
VVDDEPDVLELLSAVLRGCGCVVATAGSAAEALLALDRDRPDVLLSDVAMPGGSGYDLIRSVRARGHGHLPAAAITAYARGEDRRRALLAGFDLHVSKPIQPDELLLLVASLAGQRPA